MVLGKDNMREVMNDALDIFISNIPKLAKACKGLFDALVNEGFTGEQALKIVSNYTMGTN